MVLAKQWRHTIEPVLEARRSMPAGQWLDLAYEDLVRDPAGHALRIERFGRLAHSDAFVEHLERECRVDRVDAWRRRLEDGQLEEIRPLLEPVLDRLGYEW